MSAPTYSKTTEALFRSLPEIQRREDELQNPDWPLKRYLSTTGDQLGEVDELIVRVDYYTPSDGVVGDTSDLVDPQTADVEWLPWLGQLVGVRVNPALPEAQQRQQASGAGAGFKAGSRPALAAAVGTFLTGSKAVALYTRSTDANPNGIGTGTMWDLLIVTRGSETPMTGAQLIAAVIESGAKPAGIRLWHRTAEATWAQIEAAYTTWSTLDEKTWQQIEETGL